MSGLELVKVAFLKYRFNPFHPIGSVYHGRMKFHHLQPQLLEQSFEEQEDIRVIIFPSKIPSKAPIWPSDLRVSLENQMNHGQRKTIFCYPYRLQKETTITELLRICKECNITLFIYDDVDGRKTIEQSEDLFNLIINISQSL